MKPIRLIAVDMDGTLLDSQGRLPAGLYSLVRELNRPGNPLRHRERTPVL